MHTELTGEAKTERRLTAPMSAGMERERLIVVGRNSYIGGYLTQYAQARGASVVSLSSADCNFLVPSEVDHFFRSRDARPSTIVFLATVNKDVANTYQSFLANVQMIRHLIDGQQRAAVSSILYFSSVDIYGCRPPMPLTEDTPGAPDSWYALGKSTSEWMLQHAEEMRCPVTLLRIPGIYGLAPHDRSVIGRIVAEARTTRRMTIHGQGTSLRDYVWLADLCRLVESLLPLRYHGVLNVATGRSVPISDVFRLVGEVLELDYTPRFVDQDPMRTFDLVFDTARLRSLLPDFRFSELAEGIRTYREARP